MREKDKDKAKELVKGRTEQYQGFTREQMEAERYRLIAEIGLCSPILNPGRGARKKANRKALVLKKLVRVLDKLIPVAPRMGGAPPAPQQGGTPHSGTFDGWRDETWR